ncbi:uncharacterized protein IL334_001529 [Kwoniella shivajii]|uniref:Uncharacterized protein n=1 Tax=Kwoniella shivajii TaxID=564305 RepID=A0ABZ1CV97_9TREE|nr:hypothetical protein IL334_001529 [Kwoniella shivajii]
MELTEENAQAGDRAYLNLVLLQALGSDRTSLIWSSIWGLMIQSCLLGYILSRIWGFIEKRTRFSQITLGSICLSVSMLLIEFGFTADQTYRILSSDYVDIALDDSRRNMASVVVCGILGAFSMMNGCRELWKMKPRKSIMIPLITGSIGSIGINIGVIVVGSRMPQASVSNLNSVSRWIKELGILFRLWLGLSLVLCIWIWVALILAINTNMKERREKFIAKRRTSEAMILPTLNLIILMIYTCVEILSLVNVSRTLFQALSYSYLVSSLHFIIHFQQKVGLEEEGNHESSSVYYTSPLYPRKQSIPSLDSRSGKTASSGQTTSNGSGKSANGSVKITVDTHISESKMISSPPSAYTYGKIRRHGRYTSSPIPSPIPTPTGINSHYSDVDNIPLSIIAPFTDWLEYSNQQELSNNNNNNNLNDDSSSCKSAVPSGKTLLRTKSERSKKGNGIILDHQGWVESLPTLNKHKV